MRPGDRVRYVPMHAYRDMCHSDCEDGTISSIGEVNIFVRFDKQVGRVGWDGATSQACSPDNLVLLT